MGHGEVPLRVLGALADGVARPMCICFETWCLVEAEVPNNWKKGNITPVFIMGKAEVGGKCRAVSLTSESGKVMALHLLETLLWSVENKEVIGNREHGF